MKQLVAALFALTISFVVAAEPTKVVYQIDEASKVPLLINSINELMKSVQEADVYVVFHGPAITRLAEISPAKQAITQLLGLGVRIGACSTSMSNNRLKRNMLIDGIEYIEDGGILRILTLQKQGYGYIKI
tara:strand:- start:927 stop:1319 length:393 start_codon:yes stop_codon:yes gene_type:complete